MKALLRMLGLGGPGRRVDGPRPVSVELNRSFAIAITSVGVVVGIATAMLGFTTVTMNDVIDDLTPLATANRELFVQLDRAADGVSALLGEDDPSGRTTYERAQDGFSEVVGRAEHLARDDAELAGLVERQRALAETWFGSYATPAVAMADSDLPAARATAVAGGRTLDRFHEANLATADAIDEAHRAAHVQMRRTTFTALSVVVLIGIVGVGVALAAAVRARRRVSRSLESLVGTLEDLRAGDLTARSDVRAPAEVGRAARVVNAMADEICELQDAQARRLHEQRSLSRLSRQILSHLRTGDVLNVAAEQITKTLGVDRTVIRAIGPISDDILAEWDRPGVGPVDDLPIPDAVRKMVRYELETFDHLAIDDVRTDPRLRDAIRDYYEAVGSRALLIRGVLVGNEAYGVIAAHSISEPRSWSEFDRSVLELAARELGLALEHAILYEQEANMVVELQQLDEAKDGFVSSISHELRTPLASILGYTELLRDGDAGAMTDEQDAMLAVIERNSERLHGLIEDLLTISVLADTDDLQLRVAPTDLGALISDAITALRPRIADHGLELRTSICPNLPRVMADEPQLERVLLNLLSNAVKFSPDGGTIEVAARLVDDRVEIEVSDTGIGIDDAEQGDLFTRFFRASGARQRDIQGTGLGLIIVRSIVEQHGGTVRLRSALGVGTTVTISLPVPTG